VLRAELVERSEAVGQKHSDRVLPLIEAVLREAGLQLRDIDAFAFGAGPGSFTGLRIACGVVQGLAYACRRPVVSVGNLRALAAAAFARHPRAGVALTAIDARMHEAYCGVYLNDDAVSELRRTRARVARGARFDLPPGRRRPRGGRRTQRLPAAWGTLEADQLPELRGGAGDIARLARADFGRGLATTAAEAMPLYVRDRVALTIDERRQKVSA